MPRVAIFAAIIKDQGNVLRDLYVFGIFFR